MPRPSLLVALAVLGAVALSGCGKGDAEVPATVGTVPAATKPIDPREADVQAAYSLDAASAALDEALGATRKLAAIAGGDAKEALLDVADMLDSAGAGLSDHDEPPEEGKAFTDEERKKAVADAQDALRELREAAGTLEDLGQNVPQDHQKDLEAIQSNVDEAIDAVGSGIEGFGGKIPPEEA